MPSCVVYILRSPTTKRTYVGQTSNLPERLRRHNAGMVPSTKAYAPWELVHIEEYPNRSAAMNREKWLKTGIGREFIEIIVNQQTL